MIYSVSQVQKYMAEKYSGVNKKSKIYRDTSLIPELMIEIPLPIGESNNLKCWLHDEFLMSLFIHMRVE